MFKKINLSFKVKLIAFFLLVGIIPVIVGSTLTYQFSKANVKEEILNSMEMFAGLANASFDENFGVVRRNANALALNSDIYQSLNILKEAEWDTSDSRWLERTEVLNDLISAVMQEYGYAGIFITDFKGEVVHDINADMLGDDLSEQDCIQRALNNRTNWSELFYYDVINKNAMVISAPLRSGGSSGEIVGTINFLGGDEAISQIVHDGINELGSSANSYLIDENGLLLSNTLLGEYRENAALKQSINTRAAELLSGPVATENMDFHAQEEYVNYMGNPVLGTLAVFRMGDTPVGLVIEIDQKEAFAGLAALRNLIIIFAVIFTLVIAAVAYFIALSIVRPVQNVGEAALKVAEGDFTVQAEVKSRDEIGYMAESLNSTISSLNRILTNVRDASNNVSHAAGEISSGNQDLSQRTEEQASSLEEISATIEEVTSSLEACSANAAEADNLSKETLENVHQGETVVKDMQGAMVEITQGSQEIAEIITKVNDIAFQTNLLALNAAVEAARAGEQGRGFAVVAAEVRNLAGRAAESAKEIEKLIKDSIVRVERGNNLMTDTEKVLAMIVNNTQKTTDVVGEIAASLREQSSAAVNVRTALEELNQVTQQNASLVEEIASSSENMNSEAVHLSDQVGFFKLSENGSTRKQIDIQIQKQFPDAEKVKLSKKTIPEKISSAPSAAAVGDVEFQFNEEDFEKF